MRCFGTTALAVVCLGLRAATGAAEELTLDQALALARERAPSVVAAQLAIQESLGRLTGASVLLRDNPVVDGAAGPRLRGDGGESLEARLGFSQAFELGGQRGARISAAEADVARAGAGADNTLRVALRDVSVAFYRALHATQSLEFAGRARAMTIDIVNIADRRLAAGDIARLDVSLAQAARSRANAAVLDAEARRDAALGAVRVLLGMGPDQPLAVRGVLSADGAPSLDALQEHALERPDLRALEAEILEAEADARLANAERWPDIGLGAEYERDDNDNIALGRLSVTLPVFSRGQGRRTESLARASRLRAELEAERRVTITELRTAYDVYRRRAAAADELTRTAMPLQDNNEALARRAYESGQLGLVDLLAVRREVLGTRQESLDRSLESALAAVDLEFMAGALK
jgi:cobalt-zinc-cadmium efflux system outer membrane protein